MHSTESLQEALGSAYTLERELGGGGMSRVFLAREVALDRAVVIKVLPADLAAGVSVVRFQREIALAARLQHPHIVPLLGAGQAGDTPWFSMPFVEGQSLRAVLAAGEQPIPPTVRILRDIASALAYAHERGVVHRDIKPDNVLLSDGVAVVTDFGVAKAIAESAVTRDHAPTDATALTSAGMAMGTPAYMPPEQIAGDPRVDHRADIYALGVLAYELLAGRHPFAGRNPQQLIAAQMTEVPTPIAQVRSTTPPALAELVSACLAKSPADRPQSAREIVQRLDAMPVTSGETGASPTDSVVRGAPLVTSEARGRRLPGVVIAAVVLVFAVAGATLWKRGAGSAQPNVGGNISQIAVLPFENVGGDTANAYFADGMTDELANALSKVPALTIASRTSSYAYRDASKRDMQRIREALGVGAILEGTVTRAADKLRVSARLTRTADKVEIWSDAFVRPAGDVFAVQNELGKAIVTALTPTVGASTVVGTDTSRGTSDLEAYDRYLRAQHALELRGVENLRQSVTLFEQAARKDPKFARAFAGLAVAKVILADNVRGAETIAAEIEQAAHRAIALDSTLAEPYAALGLTYGRTGRYRAAVAALERAMALNPRLPVSHVFAGIVFDALGRPTDAVREGARAVALDPLAGAAMSNYARFLASAGRRDDAEAAIKRATTLMPAYSQVRRNVGVAFVDMNMPREALAQLDTAVLLGAASNGRIDARVRALLQLGDSTGARAVVANLDPVADAGRFFFGELPNAFASIGDKDRALAALAAPGQWGLLSAAYYESSATWAPLRNDPRFKRIMQALRDRDR